MAPFVPFLSETLWKNLTEPFSDSVRKSVHLCDYPKPIQDRIEPDLSQSMGLLREIASMGRAARANAKLKVRLPLSRVEVVLTDAQPIAWLEKHDALVREELNVKSVDYTTEADKYVQYTVVPNFKRLGPKVGKQIPAVKKALSEADGNTLLQAMQKDGKVTLDLPGGPIDLDDQDIEVRLQAREGWAAAQGSRCVVVLNTEVTDELRREGIAKDLIRTIQNQRKSIECEYLDRIEVAVDTDNDEVLKAIDEHGELIAGETLANAVTLATFPDIDPVENEYGRLFIRKVEG